MAKVSTLRDVILRFLERGELSRLGLGLLEDAPADDKLTDTDRTFLTKWLALADDPIWPEIISGADHWPHSDPPYTFPILVRYALRANRAAESGRFGRDLVLEARRKRRDERLEYAECARRLVQYLRPRRRNEAIAARFTDGYCALDELIPCLEAAVSVLEKMAGPPPATAITPPRQDRRRGRTGLRKRRLFITSMSDVLTRYYDQDVNDPYHIESVAAFARIEFPDIKSVTVRQALEPTTREGRRQRRERNKPNGPSVEMKF
jgi:hypothetical protein